MFPWTDGFHWTATHIIFLSLFFAAVAVILSTFDARIVAHALLSFVISGRRLCAGRKLCGAAGAGAGMPAPACGANRISGRATTRSTAGPVENYAKFAPLPAQVPGRAWA